MKTKITISLLDQAKASEVVAGGLYSSVKPTANSQQVLLRMSNLVKFLGPETEDFHVTVLYSKNDNGVKEQPDVSREAYKAKVDKFVIWPGHDEALYLVCCLYSPDLNAANAAWNALGYSTTFDEYRPHITFKSKIDHPRQAEALAILNNYCLIHADTLNLTFGPQIVDELRD